MVSHPLQILIAAILNEFCKGVIHKPCGQRRGEGGFLKKPCLSTRGEGVLEAGPRGQKFSYATALNVVLLREFGVFI